MIECLHGERLLKQNMAKILYVVHRYAPYPGGSENYVRDMAEETFSRGHDVTVLAGEHKGDLNGVKVTGDFQIMGSELFDLIVVHGGDVGVQDVALMNSQRIPSPMLFMLIKPSDSAVYQHAMKHVKYIGCSTKEDWDSTVKHGHRDKSVRVSHGIDANISTGVTGFREKHGITTPYMFLSCGGFWPNKAFHELITTFNAVGRDDITLVLTGYDNRHDIMPPDSENVKVMMIDDRNDVMSAIRDADLYIMHSHSEGFGLVLLESMLNRTAWASRSIAGAKVLKDFGFTYNNDSVLREYMIDFKGVPQSKLDDAYEYVMNAHLIKNTVNDILKLI
jgi:glycosyltransferase involved in cell wall biosynthesis